MYVVYGSVRTRALRVLWALEELSLGYEFVHAGPRSEAARALSPSGKVPIMTVEGATLTDSVAIVQFLADRHGGITHPAGTLRRALQDGLTQFACDELDGPLWLAARHAFVLPEAERLEGVRASAEAEFDRALVELDRRLGDATYLAGADFTVADLIVAHCLGWAEVVKFPQPTGRLAAYAKRVRGRPALGRAMARAARPAV
jgi:glutathione S-transferase